MSFWREIGFIVALALGLSLASYVVRPDALSWNADDFEIELPAARDMLDAVWVDARTQAAFDQGTYRDAIAVNEEDWETGFAGLLDVWRPGRPIIVFCASNSCLRSRAVAERLRKELGVDNAYSLKDGWDALLQAGLARSADHSEGESAR